MSKNKLFTEIPLARIRAKFMALKPVLDERLTRLWAGAEAEAAGDGGVTIVARATGMSRTTIRAGRDELRNGLAASDVVRVRRAGAGRPSIEDKVPEIVGALEALIEPTTRGGRESPLRWTLKSTRALSAELGRRGFSISPQKVGQLLHARGYSLRGGGALSPATPPAVRNRQFELINRRIEAFHARNVPVIAVDTRYAALAGDVSHCGRACQRGDEPAVAPRRGAIGTGLGGPGAQEASNGARRADRIDADVDDEMPAFALLAITEWWEHMARRAGQHATELLIMIDRVGGGAFAQRWRSALQRFADRSGLTVGVSHVPPGTSKWQCVEHRLLCHVTESWHGHPRVEREVAIQLIGSARTVHHPVALAALRGQAPGPGMSEDGSTVLITRDGVHAEWNYTLHPSS